MKYYVSCTLANGIVGYLIYEGMNQSDIVTLLTNNGNSNIQFIDENTFNIELQAQIAALLAAQGK